MHCTSSPFKFPGYGGKYKVLVVNCVTGNDLRNRNIYGRIIYKIKGNDCENVELCTWHGIGSPNMLV